MVSPKTKLKRTTLYYGGGLLFVALVLLIVKVPFFVHLNNFIVDHFQGLGLARKEILIVGIDEKSLAKLGAWAWPRRYFATALENLDRGSPRVIGVDILFVEEREGDEELIEVLNSVSSSIVFPLKFSQDSLVTKTKFTGPNIDYGFVNLDTDSDGKIRKTLIATMVNDSCFESFSSKVFNEFLGAKSLDCEQIVESEDNLRIFSYANNEFSYLSFIDVFDNNFRLEEVRDKIILIGVVVSDLKIGPDDNYSDLSGKTMPGVYFHANIINSFLNDNSYRYLAPGISTLFLFGVSFILLWIYRKTKNNLISFAVTLLFLVLLNIGGAYLFESGIIWCFVATILAILTAYVFSIAYKSIITLRENRFIKRTFAQYISPVLLRKILKDPRLVKLGGYKTEMTVLFCDIRGFTGLCERLPAEKVMGLLNEYLTEFSDVILSHGGTIDKYIGDGIMAFWNAPLKDKKHQLKALSCAIGMTSVLKRFNKNHPEYPDLEIGIGVNTGLMIVGNIGGNKRFDYTVLGDNVNSAYRLEGLTKYYGVEILLAQSVIKNINTPTIIYRLIDETVVKGKTEAMRIYQPLEMTSQNLRLKKDYETALRAYRNGDFNEAKKRFAKLKDDPPSQLISKRISIVKRRKHWDGVWVWQTK